MSKNKVSLEKDVFNVLSKDGIKKIDLVNQNQIYNSFSQFQKDSSWAKRIIYNETFAAHVICQKPGETNRTHFHKNHDECWVVLSGKIKWWIEGEKIIEANKGDIIFAPRGKQHKIKTIGNENSLRLAISPPDIPHYHPDIDNAPKDF